MSYNFTQKIQQTEKQFGLGQNDAFQFEKGPNKIRVLTMSEKPLATHWVGKKSFNCIGEEEGCFYHGDNAPLNDKGEPARPSIKYLAYILDRRDNQIKLMYVPYSVYKAVADLFNNDDYKFDDLPMPYDLTITYDKDGSPAQMYSTLPSPNRSNVPDDFMVKVRAMKSVDEIRESILNKQRGVETKSVVTPSGKAITDKEIPIVEDTFEDESTIKEDLPF